MKRIAVITFALLVLLLGHAECARQRQFSAKQREDICEAVFRILLPDTKERYAPEVYFLQVIGRDPSKSLLSRLRYWKAPIKPASESTRLKKLFQVVDKKTKERGAIVSVDHIKQISKTKAEVEGGYSANGRAGAWHWLAVELRKGKWSVTKHKLRGVS